LATINTTNDPNRTQSTANAAPAANPAASGAPTSSGNFSTLQKYLGANQGAGQRLAGMIGGNVNKEGNRLQTTTQREQGEVNQANQNFGKLTNQTQDFTQQLSQPTQGATGNTDAKKAYDVNSYATNLAGQQAANQIAQNQEQLQQFTGIRTGDTAKQRQQESQKQADEAMQAATKQYDVNAERQKQLRLNQGRDELLKQALNSQNQRTGLRNLDNAFLTQDKTKSLDNVSNQLKQNVQGIQAMRDTANMSREDVIKLRQQQDDAQQSLLGRLNAIQSEYDQSLDSRMGSVNAAKDKRLAALQDQFKNLQSGGEIKSEFSDMLGLDQVARTGALDTSGDVSAQGMGNGSLRLFNELNNQNLGNVLNTGLLEQKAQTRADVANQQDISNLNALAALSGNQNNITNVSKFMGNQTDKAIDAQGRTFADRLNERAGKFATEDLTKTFTGSGYKQEDIGGSSAMARAYSNAAASLNDVLQGNIYRNTQGSQSKGWENSLGSALAGITLGGNLGIPFATNQDVREGADAAIRGVIQGGTNILPGAMVGMNPQVSNAVGGYLRSLQGQMRGTGMTADGGLGGRNIGSGEWGRSMNYADAQSVGQVNDQAQNYLKDIGYNNLVKIAKGEI
jgi:hypothetical protein